jgi:hypothetical protein
MNFPVLPGSVQKKESYLVFNTKDISYGGPNTQHEACHPGLSLFGKTGKPKAKADLALRTASQLTSQGLANERADGRVHARK